MACVTAHAAIDKSCDMLGIRLIKIPMDPKTGKLNVSAMSAAIGPNTIMLYASAPNFPQGVIDDIEAVRRCQSVHIYTAFDDVSWLLGRQVGVQI